MVGYTAQRCGMSLEGWDQNLMTARMHARTNTDVQIEQHPFLTPEAKSNYSKCLEFYWYSHAGLTSDDVISLQC